MPWKTFWLEHTGRERVGLRRYTLSEPGSPDAACGDRNHWALVWTGDEMPTAWSGHGTSETSRRLTIPADDPRWPAGCARCGREFTDDDERQVWTEALYRRVDNGDLVVLHHELVPPGAVSAGPGAMWDATWMPAQWRGPDGVALMVRCPRNDLDPVGGSDWAVDMPSTNSGRPWKRTGDPRRARVTADPSISIGTPGAPGAYHGWLQDGVLSDPL